MNEHGQIRQPGRWATFLVGGTALGMVVTWLLLLVWIAVGIR